VRRYLKRLVASRVARSNSNRIIMKTISPTEILFMAKFVQNLIIYQKYSDHFHVGVTQISVSGRNRLTKSDNFSNNFTILVKSRLNTVHIWK
jgi:hypothetical protein